MIALLGRRPLISFFVIAFSWTWAFVIFFLILFPQQHRQPALGGN
jgi:hypothetical protein